MPAARIHRAGPADATVMAALHAACFPQGWDEAAMSSFVTAPSVLCLIGSVPPAIGSPAGFLIARRAADEAELLTIGVAPPCRRAGLGRALLSHACTELSASGARQLFLEVDEANASAVALYRALGAERVGHREGYYESGADAAIFSLALCDPPSDDGRTAR